MSPHGASRTQGKEFLMKKLHWMTRFLTVGALAASFGLTGCGDVEDDGPDPDPTPSGSIYEQLGGEAALTAVVDVFLGNVLANEEINWMFVNTDGERLGALLVEQVCEATGGPCTYSGQDMTTAHAGMGITSDQFMSLAVNFVEALAELEVPYTETLDAVETPADVVVQALLGMQSDIVEDATGTSVLFNEIGGYGAVTAVVQGLLQRVAANDSINGFFASTDLALLETLLIEQICAATGGFCTYTGRSMEESHRGLGIATADFNQLVGDLLDTLDDLGVSYAITTPNEPAQPIDALLAALLGMCSDIVEVDPENCAS